MTTQQEVFELLSWIGGELVTKKFVHIPTKDPKKLHRNLYDLTRRRGNYNWRFLESDGGIYVSLVPERKTHRARKQKTPSQ